MRTTYIKFLLLLLLGGNIYPALAQVGPGWAWAVNNNMISTDGMSLVTDASGNVYTAGSNLSKHSPSGTLLWSKSLINTTQGVYAKGLAIDVAGNLYLAGYFGGTIQLDTATLTSYGHTDIFVAKFNINGQVQWARHAGGPGPPPGFPPSPGQLFDNANAIAVDSAGNCYVTGFCQDAAKFDTIIADSTTRNFVAKYNTSGNIQWVRRVSQEAYGISIGQQGSYYLSGRFVTFTTNGIYCEKYNANGNLAWSKQSTTNGYNYATSVATDLFGNCFITGIAYDTVVFDQVTVIPPVSGGCMFLVKYNATGAVQWGRQTTGSGCGGNHVSTDNQGNAYVTGGITGAVSFSGTVQLNGMNNGWQDIYAAKYNANGDLNWALRAGSSGSDYGKSIGVLPNGDVYVTGSHQNGSAFGNINLAGSNTYNFFVAKISANPLCVSKPKSISGLVFYPNPANSKVKLSGSPLKEGRIEICNLTGQKVYEAQLKPESEFSVADWPAGIYLVKLQSREGAFTQKLVITH